MKILIEQSGYHLGNIGDLAMLQVAVQRLKSFWPNASVQIFTTDSEKLIKYFPNTQPLPPYGRQIWHYPLLHRVHKLPSRLVIQQWVNMELRFRRYLPSLVRSLIKFKLRKQPEQMRNFEAFMEAVYGADLVVASGGGYITDVFKQNAILAIDTLGLATRLGKPTVMLGHGLGPLQDKELRAKAKTVLPLVNLITLREKRAGVPLLNSIGVSQDCVMATGDDAIELAYQARKIGLGNGIGINLRIAEYSGVNLSLLETIRLTLHKAAKKWNAPLIPAPIDHSNYEGYVEI
ncbi:MAG: hypothetical protein HC773_23150 [Scytonema sp. CRU_2_7]|nr:hypothetical protein [Scytonema sp. CRU_2_7]